MTYRCEVPGCGQPVRVVCSKGHAYEPHEDGSQMTVPGVPVDSAAVARAAEAARGVMGAPVLTPAMQQAKAADNAAQSRRVPSGRSYSTTANAMKMPFGKYKGEPIEDLPTDYLEWCLREMDSLREPLREEMEAQLTMRGGRGVNRGKRR